MSSPVNPNESTGTIPDEFDTDFITPDDQDTSSDVPDFIEKLDAPSDSSPTSSGGTGSGNRRSSTSFITEKTLSSGDREKWHRVKQAYRIIHVIAIFILLLGVIASAFHIHMLQDTGFGVFAVASAAVLGLLGYGVFRGSVPCLCLAILLSLTNAVLLLITGGDTRYPGIRVGGCAIQLVLLYPMIRALPALVNLRQVNWKVNQLASTSTDANILNVSAGLFSLTVTVLFGLQISALTGPEVFDNQFQPDEANVILTQKPPGSPEQENKPLQLQFGDLRGKQYHWISSDTVYTLAVYDVPRQMVKTYSNERLLENFFREYSNQIRKKLRQQTVNRKAFYGMNVVFLEHSPQLEGISKVHASMYLQNSTLILVIYRSKKNTYNRDDAESFTNSLQLN